MTLPPHPPPSARQLVGTLAIVAFIAVYAILVASFSHSVIRWPMLVQALFYLVVGVGWVFPLKPLLRWTVTGRFTR